ncbi:MAG: hypothetical protein AAB592_00885, partial [Patescibacteria group bacterium]
MVKPDRFTGSPAEARQKERVPSGAYQAAKVVSSVAAAVAATLASSQAYAQDMPEPREFPGVSGEMPVKEITLSPDGVARWIECTNVSCNDESLQLQAPITISGDGIAIGEIESQDPPTTPYGQQVIVTEGGNTFVDDGGIISRNGEPWFHINSGGVWSMNQYPGGKLAIGLTRDVRQRGSSDIFLIDENTPGGSSTDFWSTAVPLRDINRADRNEFGIAVFPERGEAFVSVQQLREGAIDMFDNVSPADIVRYEADMSVYDPAHRWVNPVLMPTLSDPDRFEYTPSCIEQVLVDDATGDRTLASCLSFIRTIPFQQTTALYSCVYMPAPVADVDHDLTPDAEDNCLGVANRDQADWDEDGLGDACDT